MNIFTIVKKVAYWENEEEVIKEEKHKIELPSDPSEIPMKTWVAWQLVRENAPVWFKEVAALDEEERKEAVLQWDEEKWNAYIVQIAKEICIFANDTTIEEIIEGSTPNDEEQAGLLAMYGTIMKPILNYEPKARKSFVYRGLKFVFPKSLIDNMGNKTLGAEITTIEAIEALQAEHVYSQKDESGQFIMKDRKYHTDLALLTAIARRVEENGKIEKMPLDFIKRRRFFNSRMKFFEDVPFTIALDMAFFLTNSKMQSVRTLILNRYSEKPKRSRRKRRKR